MRQLTDDFTVLKRSISNEKKALKELLSFYFESARIRDPMEKSMIEAQIKALQKQVGKK